MTVTGTESGDTMTTGDKLVAAKVEASEAKAKLAARDTSDVAVAAARKEEAERVQQMTRDAAALQQRQQQNPQMFQAQMLWMFQQQ